MATLYALTNDYKTVLDIMSDPEVDEAVVKDTLEAIKASIEVKTDGYAAVLRQLTGEVKMLEEEADFIAAAIITRKNNIKRMKEAIANAMEVMDVTEIRGDKHSFKLVNNGGVQPIAYTDDVPDKYTRIIIEPDPAKIRKDLEAGLNLAFAHLEPRGKHITIK